MPENLLNASRSQPANPGSFPFPHLPASCILHPDTSPLSLAPYLSPIALFHDA
jgi:hypothetical protein